MAVVCGWCGQVAGDRCSNCGRDPLVPWQQRGTDAPVIAETAGRPVLDGPSVRRRLAAARLSVEQAGRTVTAETMAEVLDVSPRTVRRWQQVSG